MEGEVTATPEAPVAAPGVTERGVDSARDAFARRVLPLIHARLAAAYGLPLQDSFSHPTEELVRTILSQNTNDVNRDRAFDHLRCRFPTWSAVAEAPVAAVAEAIASGGLSQIKAPRIQNALAAVSARSPDFDLSFICGLSVDEARAWLAALPGVGPKTAACVLLFSCGKPVMPVDTHILRVSKRVGLIADGTGADAAHVAFARVLPPDLVYPLHLNLIRHGRRTCHPRRPACYACAIADLCLYEDKTPPPA
ncbi:MAG: endonuclease III domain-containing protein [Anaerolineae bacterium]